MKIKSGFMLREIAGQWVVVPLGPRVVEFKSIIELSESAAFLWRMLEQGTNEDEMVNALLKEYDVDEALARNDVKAFTDSIIDKSICQ